MHVDMDTCIKTLDYILVFVSMSTLGLAGRDIITLDPANTVKQSIALTCHTVG